MITTRRILLRRKAAIRRAMRVETRRSAGSNTPTATTHLQFRPAHLLESARRKPL
jgi:hypothetical protein